MNEEKSNRKGLFSLGSAIVVATLASACCILPVVFGAMGISAVAAAGFFESLRPVLLGITAACLALGFYFAYRPVRAPEGAACKAPAGGVSRFGKPMLWLGTIAVISLALFPSYAARLQKPVMPASEIAALATSRHVILQVEGMTCEACTSGVSSELLKVPGVVGADVEYKAGVARVSWRQNEPPNAADLIAAVERAGYSAQVATPGPCFPTRSRTSVAQCSMGGSTRQHGISHPDGSRGFVVGPSASRQSSSFNSAVEGIRCRVGLRSELESAIGPHATASFLRIRKPGGRSYSNRVERVLEAGNALFAGG